MCRSLYLEGAEQSSAAARDDALLNSGAGGVERIGDAVLLLVDLNLADTADLRRKQTKKKKNIM